MFGWGRRSKQWKLDEEHGLVCQYTYIHFFFIFKLITKMQWVVMGNDRGQDRLLTYEEVKTLIPHNTPSFSLWERFGLLFFVGGIMLFGWLYGMVNPSAGSTYGY